MEGRIQGRSGTSKPGESAATEGTRPGAESCCDAAAVSDADTGTGSGAAIEDRRILEGEKQFHTATAPGKALDDRSRGGHREFQR